MQNVPIKIPFSRRLLSRGLRRRGRGRKTYTLSVHKLTQELLVALTFERKRPGDFIAEDPSFEVMDIRTCHEFPSLVNQGLVNEVVEPRHFTPPLELFMS